MRISTPLRAIILVGPAVGPLLWTFGASAGAVPGARTAPSSRTVPEARAPRLAANRRAARADAVRLLASLQLPPGATPSAREPAGAGQWLRPMLSLNAASARADRHAWWVVGGAPDAVLGYVRAHAPAGASVTGTGSGSDMRTGSSSETIEFGWPQVPGVLGQRELEVTVTALAADRTGVLAQSQSDWIVPRPASERVPRAARVVEIAGGPLNGAPTITHTVTGAGRVRKIVALIDGLPIVQPGVYSCPDEMLRGAREITITFRARAGGRVLARASYADYPPLTASWGPCGSVLFTVEGRRRAPLIAGRLVRRLERIAQVRLTRRRP